MVWTTYGFFPSSVLRCVSKDSRRLSGACKIKQSQQEQSRTVLIVGHGPRGWQCWSYGRTQGTTQSMTKTNTGLFVTVDSSQIYKEQNLLCFHKFQFDSRIKSKCWKSCNLFITREVMHSPFWAAWSCLAFTNFWNASAVSEPSQVQLWGWWAAIFYISTSCVCSWIFSIIKNWKLAVNVNLWIWSDIPYF